MSGFWDIFRTDFFEVCPLGEIQREAGNNLCKKVTIKVQIFESYGVCQGSNVIRKKGDGSRLNLNRGSNGICWLDTGVNFGVFCNDIFISFWLFHLTSIYFFFFYQSVDYEKKFSTLIDRFHCYTAWLLLCLLDSAARILSAPLFDTWQTLKTQPYIYLIVSIVINPFVNVQLSDENTHHSKFFGTINFWNDLMFLLQSFGMMFHIWIFWKIFLIGIFFYLMRWCFWTFFVLGEIFDLKSIFSIWIIRVVINFEGLN